MDAPEIVVLDSQPALVMRETMLGSQIADRLGHIFPTVYGCAGDLCTGPPFARWVAMRQVGEETEFDVEAGFPVSQVPEEMTPGLLMSELPGGRAIQAVHLGSYDGLTQSYEAVFAWMKESGLEPAGAPWDCYFDDPCKVSDMNALRTLILWPIR